MNRLYEDFIRTTSSETAQISTYSMRRPFLSCEDPNSAQYRSEFAKLRITSSLSLVQIVPETKFNLCDIPPWGAGGVCHRISLNLKVDQYSKVLIVHFVL